MANLITEYRYILQIGVEEVVLRVQELIWGAEPWPEKCRIQLPASPTRAAQKFYGANPREVVEKAVQYLEESESRASGTRMPSSQRRESKN